LAATTIIRVIIVKISSLIIIKVKF